MHPLSICGNHAARCSYLIGQGKQSQVYLTQGTIKKVIGTNKRLRPCEAANLIIQLRHYRKILSSHGWHIPELYSANVCHHPGGYELVIYEQYIQGPVFVEVLANRGTIQVMQLLLPLLQHLYTEQTIKITHNHRALHRISYGVDLKPENIIYNSATDTVFLVDTFAPKTINASGVWDYFNPAFDSLNPKELLVVTATREGMLLRLLRLMGIHATTPEYDKFCHLLKSTNINKDEFALINSEIRAGYPLLEGIYRSQSNQ